TAPNQTVLDFFNFSKYAIVFILCIVEGPVVMITSGFLYRLGQFDLVPLYFALMGGDFVADIGWYGVGRFGAKPILHKFGGFLNITPEIIAKIEKRFKTYQNKILFISKITMGFGFALATLIVAGMLRVDFKKYVILNLFGGFIWTAFLLLVGYFFGHLYASVVGPMKIVFVFVSIFVVIYALWAINRYLVKTEI
ncbi:MAG: DedA family protein, partial [Patescibacteria group bacterium]|nr:DedA family protein [Patescibacteria group bacterium]